MKHYAVTEELLQKVINYLASKPFVEVMDLIPALRTLPTIEIAKDEEIKKD